MLPQIVVVNRCVDLVDHATAQKWVDAWQRQIAGDFAPVWNKAALLHYAGDTEKLDATDWLLSLVRASATDGALGSHWLDGRPTGEVGVQTCIDDGVEPSSCGSHEILEMVLDEYATLAFQSGHFILAAEACDRCEGSDGDYRIDGVQVENFSLPSAFINGAGPWDFRKKCSSNRVLSNGYQLQISLGNGVQWQQVTGAGARRAKRVAGAKSRRASRMLRAGADPKSLVLVPA